MQTSHMERVQHPNGYGKRIGDCGDTIEFFLTCRGNRLMQVAFQVEGCLNTVACCNTIVSMCQGSTLDQAWEITPEQVIDFLKTLPEDHFHCAQLAVGAFYLALADIKKRIPGYGLKK